MRVVVVGGGVTGLAAARAVRAEARRRDLQVEVLLLEASDRFGGKIRTDRFGGTIMEAGPDAFVARKPEVRALAAELGLKDDLVGPGTSTGGAHLLDGDRLMPFPRGTALGIPRRFRTLLGTPLLSPRGKIRAALEPVLGRAPRGPDPSIWEAVAGRFGAEVADRLVDPLIGGLYGSTRRLSLRAVMPEMESLLRRGGMLRGRLRPRSAGTAPAGPLSGPVIATLRGGLDQLTERLRSQLEGDGQDLRLGAPVRALSRRGRMFVLETPDGQEQADAVVLALAAPVAARLLHGAAPDAARPLGGIRHPASTVLLLRYPASAVSGPPPGAGFLAMPGRGSSLVACTWWPAKWPHLATSDEVLLRVFPAEALTQLDDDRLAEVVSREIGRGPLGLRGLPLESRVVRWDPGTPRYELGHRHRVEQAEAALPPGLVLAGDSYRGPGLPGCVADAARAGRLVGGYLAARTESLRV